MKELEIPSSKNPQWPATPSEAEKTLQSSSLAFELIRLELEGSKASFHQFDLDEKLDFYKKSYFEARRYLELYDPERLRKVEEQLIQQKKDLFTFHAA